MLRRVPRAVKGWTSSALFGSLLTQITYRAFSLSCEFERISEYTSPARFLNRESAPDISNYFTTSSFPALAATCKAVSRISNMSSNELGHIFDRASALVQARLGTECRQQSVNFGHSVDKRSLWPSRVPSGANAVQSSERIKVAPRWR